MNNKQISESLYGVDAPKRCPQCQAVWPDNAKFCGYDGEKLIINRLAQNNQSLHSDAETDAIYCGGCGYTHKPGKCPDDSDNHR